MSFDHECQAAAQFGRQVATMLKAAGQPGLPGPMPNPASINGYKTVQQTSGTLSMAPPASKPVNKLTGTPSASKPMGTIDPNYYANTGLVQGPTPKPASIGGYKTVQQTSGVLSNPAPKSAPTGQIDPNYQSKMAPKPTTQFDPATMGPSAPYGSQQFPVQAGMRMPSGKTAIPGIGTMPSRMPVAPTPKPPDEISQVLSPRYGARAIENRLYEAPPGSPINTPLR